MIDENERRQVEEITSRVHDWKAHWTEWHEHIKKCRAFVKKGASKDWNGAVVNMCARVIRDQVSNLYARTPKTIYRRRPRMEFEIWDEDPQAFLAALQTISANPMDMEARMLVEDVVRGFNMRETYDKTGQTLTHLFNYFRDEQFYGSRRQMKKVIRRGFVDSVAYIRPTFQRVMDPAPDDRELVDAKMRLDEIERRARRLEEGEMQAEDPEAIELRQMIAELEAQKQVIVREGLTFHFPDALSIIPDTNLEDFHGFEGCNEVAEEFNMPRAEAEATYGVKLDEVACYDRDGKKSEEGDHVRVWMVWNKTTGLVHTVCDGFKEFLTRDFSPPVYIERFWPWEVFAPFPSDDPDDPTPVSLVAMLESPCMEINRGYEGLAEHRKAARPRTFGAVPINSKDVRKLSTQKANSHVVLESVPPDQIDQAILPMPVPGIDMLVYDPTPSLQAIEQITSMSEARFDPKARVSATATTLSESQASANTNSLRDELDDLNNRIARMSGQILLYEMSEGEVKRIVGPGAVWPEPDLQAIAEELHLMTEFGSSGFPNQAQRVATLRDLGQMLVQIPGISVEKLAQLYLEAVDQNIDMADFFDPKQMLSIQAQNQQAGVVNGADNAPRPDGPSSTEPVITAAGR